MILISLTKQCIYEKLKWHRYRGETLPYGKRGHGIDRNEVMPSVGNFFLRDTYVEYFMTDGLAIAADLPSGNTFGL